MYLNYLAERRMNFVFLNTSYTTRRDRSVYPLNECYRINDLSKRIDEVL